MEPVTCSRLRDLAEERLCIPLDQRLKKSVVLVPLEEHRCIDPKSVSRNLRKSAHRKATERHEGDTHDPLVPNGGDLDDSSSVEGGNQRDDSAGGEVAGSIGTPGSNSTVLTGRLNVA